MPKLVKRTALTPEEGFKILLPVLKSNNLGFDIFKFLETLRAILILRGLSRRGMQFSLVFHQQADVVRNKISWGPENIYKGVNLFKIPVEVTIGCDMDAKKL